MKWVNNTLALAFVLFPVIAPSLVLKTPHITTVPVLLKILADTERA
jgi:hypothetical protein